ncbi:MAG: carboxypeptidase regulatory-like domain-containing protein [Planctomycetes bacterium]|nr:carboxypeptidase regulatory-like domain-containing protein [Planctomycetota bacterium]
MGPPARAVTRRWTLAAALAAGIVGVLAGLWSLRRGPVPVASVPAEGPEGFAPGGDPIATSPVPAKGARPPEARPGGEPAAGAGGAGEKPPPAEATDGPTERSVAVWGLVLGLDERPAPDMLVEWNRSQHALKPVAAVTDPTGRYELSGLEPGQYLVRAVPRLLAPAWEEAPRRLVTLREGAANRFDFTGDAGRDLAVVVLDGEGRAEAGIQVHFELRTAARGVSGFLPATAGDGRTLFRGLPRAGTLALDVPTGGGKAVELDLEDLPAEARLALR